MMSLRRTNPWALVSGVAILALLLAAPPFLNDYLLRLAITSLMFVSLGVSWNLAGGYAGQQSLGTAALFGVGAYGAMLTAIHLTADVLPSLLIGGLAATATSLVTYPTFRLRGIYFGIATLALGESLRVIAEQVFPGQTSGLHVGVGFGVNQGEPYYWMLGIALTTLAVVGWVIRSPIGLALLAIREDEDAARAIGVAAARYKLAAFAISAFFAGLVGGFYARFLGYIDPRTVFATDHSINPIFVTMLGGIGTELGPVVGAVLWVLIQEVLRGLTGSPALNTIVYGVLLTVLVIASPRGMVGGIQDRLRRRRPSRERAPSDQAEEASRVTRAAAGY